MLKSQPRAIQGSPRRRQQAVGQAGLHFSVRARGGGLRAQQTRQTSVCESLTLPLPAPLPLPGMMLKEPAVPLVLLTE